MKKLMLMISLLSIFALSDGFERGERIFKNKCSQCHAGFINSKLIKENFFEKNNTLLNLGAPTENMLAYAIMRSSRHIGDPSDPEMQQIEIEEYLQSYLQNPKRENSICDPEILKFYDAKAPLKDKIRDEDVSALAIFFMEYKKNRSKRSASQKTSVKQIKNTFTIGQIAAQAQKENKHIIIEASTPTCHYCKKMEHEVIETKEVQDLLKKDYLFVNINIKKHILPFGLEKIFKHVTPSFFILDSKGILISEYPGSLRKNDFIDILKHNKPKEN